MAILEDRRQPYYARVDAQNELAKNPIVQEYGNLPKSPLKFVCRKKRNRETKNREAKA